MVLSNYLTFQCLHLFGIHISFLYQKLSLLTVISNHHQHWTLQNMQQIPLDCIFQETIRKFFPFIQQAESLGATSAARRESGSTILVRERFKPSCWLCAITIFLLLWVLRSPTTQHQHTAHVCTTRCSSCAKHVTKSKSIVSDSKSSVWTTMFIIYHLWGVIGMHGDEQSPYFKEVIYYIRHRSLLKIPV